MHTFAKLDGRYLDRPYTLAGRTIDPIVGTCTYGGRRAALNRKQLEVLACLAAAGTEMVPRQSFIDLIWHGNGLVGENSLTNAVYGLRRLLQDSDPDNPLFRTIPRRGYQLTVAAGEVEDTHPVAFAAGMPIAGKPGWQLARRLGGNAISELWLAEEPATGERRVFRFCRSEQHLQLLRRETTVLRYLRQALAGRRDTAVVLDWQLDEPPYHLEMDYASGGSLIEWADAQGGLAQVTYPIRMQLMVEVAEALAAVHQADVVHRNLSPASVLIDAGEGSHAPHARLGEFGLSEVSDRSRLEALQITSAGLTLTGDLAGEALYLAPERLAGSDATAAGDVYALGVLTLQLATGDLGRTPVGDWQQAVGVPPLVELIAACISATPGARPIAGAVAERLRALIQAARDAQRSAVDVAPACTAPTPAHAGASADAPAAVGMPASAQAARESAAADPAVGSHVGPYHLLDQLGEGGMGVVYLAEQHTPVQRKVALKVVRTGLMSSDVRARFEAERQAMALMNHANVASVFDAGSTPAGQPYFAMEYVQGQEITAHCDQLRLDFRGRIQLFLQVCEGVLHAHQKGLVHRDLKPGNILVSRAKDQPAAVKIIDFGVAKSMSGMLAANPAHTRLGSFVGTPAYSSPEQVSGPVANVDTRADIYSLGVVLYELLSGVTPYSPDELNRKTPVELARLLSGEHPPSPLMRYASLSREEEKTIAERRALTVDEMKAQLDADVSWILGKCLEVDPDDRYPSVLELEKDLRRWLDNLPVQARPATRLYKLRKFVRRHRLGVAAATLGTLALLTTTGAAIYGYVRAEQAREEAQMAAEFQTKQIQDINPAVMGLALRESLRDAVKKNGIDRGWGTAEVSQGQRQLDHLIEGLDFTTLALGQIDAYSLQPALNAIEKDYGQQPLLQAQLWQTTADTLSKLGRFDKAVEPQKLALERRSALLGPEHPLTLRSMIQHAELDSMLRRYQQAEATMRSAYETARRSLGEHDPITLQAMGGLANMLYTQGKLADAKKMQLEALLAMRKTLGDDHPTTQVSMRRLVRVLAQLGESEEAIRYGTTALEGHRRVFGDTPETLQAVDVLAMAHWTNGDMARSEALVRETTDGFRRFYGKAHERTLGTTSNLSLLLTSAGKYSEAEIRLLDAINIAEPIYGDRSELLITLRRNLGQVYFLQGRLAKAESTFRELVAINRKALGDRHPHTALDLNSLATISVEQDHLDQAAAAFREALNVRRDKLGPEHPATLDTMLRLAGVLIVKGDLDAAQALQTRALDTARRSLGDTDQLTLTAISQTGALAHARGDLDRAETLLREALSRQNKSETIDGWRDTATTQDRLIEVLRKRGELEQAAIAGTELIALAGKNLTPGHYLAARYSANHARTLIELRRYEEAERTLSLAMDALSQRADQDPRSQRMLMLAYISLFERWDTTHPDQGKRREAAAWRQRLAAMDRTTGSAMAMH